MSICTHQKFYIGGRVVSDLRLGACPLPLEPPVVEVGVVVAFITGCVIVGQCEACK